VSLETGTFINDLQPNNPPGGDKKSEGDNHLRLIKDVLQKTFPGATKSFFLPTAVAKTADFFVVHTPLSFVSDMGKTFYIDTTAGAVTATLPAMAASDAGWECSFIKTNTGLNPFFIAPASGTLQSGEVGGLAKTRRCIPGHRTRVIWTGVAWFAERVPRLPIGSIIDCPLSGLPVGYEWAAGQSIGLAANYPDYNAVVGGLTVPDRRGRASYGRDDMNGVAVGRITSTESGIAGATLGAAGGSQNRITLLQSDLPNVDQAGVTTIAASSAAINRRTNHAATGIGADGSGGFQIYDAVGATNDPRPITFGTITTTVRINGNVTQTLINKFPPAQITNMIVVVE
jgi:hypothetical protein